MSLALAHLAARAHRHRGHAHFWHRALSRRRFVQTSAGLAVVAFGATPRSARLARAAQADGAQPKPIPGGFDPGTGTIIHLVLPGTGVELSTIGDFRGLVGTTHIGGEGTVTAGGGGGGLSEPATEGERLLFDADMRFMQGVYVGEDGQEHEGTFGFVWLDLFRGSVDPDFANQIHDFNPGIEANGLFWTIAVPDDAVTVDLAAGTAEMHISDLAVMDGYSVPNALGGGPSEPATVSYDLVFGDPTAVVHASDAESQVAGTFLDVTATLAWTASTADFAFESDEAGTSFTDFARIGFEANGVYFPAEPPPGATPVATPA